MARITINGVSIDPVAQVEATAAIQQESAESSDYILVQTHEPMSEADSEALAQVGAVVHEYVSENTYLCGFKPSELSAVRALPFVAWADVYHKGFKLAPSLRPSTMDARTSLVPVEAAQATLRTLHHVDVVLHEDVDPTTGDLLGRLAAAAHLNPEDIQEAGVVGQRKIRLNVEERYLSNLADMDEVRHVEEVPVRKLFNNVARGILHANVVVNSTTYQGDGQVVCVNDTGFDNGSTTGTHPAFTGRVLSLTALGRPGRSDDPNGHGTHVAGSVLGDGFSTSMGGAIQGTAPKAKLVFQSLLDSGGGLGGIPADLRNLFGPPYTGNGVRIQTNSWGSTTPGLPYNASSTEIDDFIWNHQDCTILFAAGNDGIDANRDGMIDPGSIGSEAAAKNAIVVGASESVRPNIALTYGGLRPTSWPVSPIFSDPTANHSTGMAAFSSRGPTKERRIKPDVVAPGTSILSTRSSRVTSPPTIFGTSLDPLYFFDDGTSMATPLVAGCMAVLRETLVKNGLANPTAALLKALLINGADELLGQYSPSEAGPSPNVNSGWGLVDLNGSVIIPGPNANAGFSQGGPLKQGQSSSFTVNVPRHPADAVDGLGSGPTFKITLVWTDPAGALLQNDLDLIVKASNGVERHGNMGTGSGFDRANNVEQVLWTNVPAGPLDITIRAFHITRFPQPWAYAWRLS